MLIEAVLLSKVGNGILPLAGIIAMGVTSALLVVTRGKLIRMIIFGSLLLPLFLAGDDDDAPVLLREITGQMAADETAAAQKDDDGFLFHESFLAWTDRPLLFATAAGLESMVVGEREIAGQLRRVATVARADRDRKSVV